MRRIVVYGLGDNFIKNYAWISEGYEIVALVDKNPNREGEIIDGQSVVLPYVITTLDYDWVMVTPNAFKVIREELVELGVKKKDIHSIYEYVHSENVGTSFSCCICCHGSIREMVHDLNYIWYFRNVFKGGQMTFSVSFPEPLSEEMKILCEGNTLFDSVQTNNQVDVDEYDLVITIRRYPEVTYADRYKISRLMPELIDYILLLDKFKIFHPRHFFPGIEVYGDNCIWELLHGHDRIRHLDIGDYLGMTEEFMFPLAPDVRRLDNRANEGTGIIAVGNYEEKRNAGSWPKEYWDILLNYVEDKFSEYEIVSMKDDMGFMERIHILRDAIIYIGVDNEDIDLRYALDGGTSVVLFGSTAPEYNGYNENLNIRSASCPYPCDRLVTSKDHICAIEGSEKYKCMKGLKPQMVIAALDRWLEER